jgi:rSAM/selenodomain-associated transferase 1
MQVLVIAKQPVAGRVKTRLCPPCTPQQAAAVADAALRDTLDAVSATPAARRTLVVHGCYAAPPGWLVAHQRGDGLGERLANAFADTAVAGTASLLVGMDTPQLSPRLLARAAGALDTADAVLGPAEDGGWWLLALRDPRHAAALAGVRMSTATTGADTVLALRRRGLTVAPAPVLRDVDTAPDAWAVAGANPDGRFAAAVRRHVPVACKR